MKDRLGLFAVACGLIVLAAAISGGRAHWGAINMTVEASKVAGILAPVAFAATVVERAIEIMISPWRDGDAARLQARAKAAGATAADQENLRAYKEATKRIAFLLGLMVSAILSISGVRAMGGFVNADSFKAAPELQQTIFTAVDVALTALVLAGGADGVHSIVSAVTAYFDNTPARKDQAA